MEENPLDLTGCQRYIFDSLSVPEIIIESKTFGLQNNTFRSA